jgi:hypothetical protein
MPHLAHLKMSQTIDWKKDPIGYIKQPRSNSGIQVTPTLIVYPTVLEALKKVDALGFNISSYWDVVNLMKMHVDPSILGAIEDMSPEEYQSVYTTLIKGSTLSGHKGTRISMNMIVSVPHITMRALIAQTQNLDEFAELLRLLVDAGFDVTSLRVARYVLTVLGRSNSPFAELAQRLVTVTNDTTAWENAVVNNWHLIAPPTPTPESLGYNPVIEKESPPQQVLPMPTERTPTLEELGYPVTLEKEYFPNEFGSPDMITDESDELELEQNVPAPPPTPNKPVVSTPPTAPVPAMPAMPTKTKGQGAVPTSRQLQETVGKYEELRQAVPAGVRSLEWGSNSGVRVKNRDGRGDDIAKGGMLLKNYGTTEDGILVGVTGSGKLYVRVPLN